METSSSGKCVARVPSWWCVYHRRPPIGTPLAFWRTIRLLRGTVACLGALAVLALLFWILGPTVPSSALQRMSGKALILACLFALAANIGFPLAWSRAKRRFERHLAAHEGCLCTACGYGLNGLPPRHVCPECGAPYDRNQCMRTWVAWSTMGWGCASDPPHAETASEQRHDSRGP